MTRTKKGIGVFASLTSAAILFVACGGSAPGGPAAGGAAAPAASSLVVTPSPLIVSNNPGAEVDVTVTALSTGGQAVPGVPLTLTSSDGGVVISPGNASTDATGQVSAKVRLLSRTNRAVTIDVSSASVSGIGSFVVQGSTLSATVETPRPAVGAKARVRFSLTDASSNPMPGETIQITSSLNSFPPVAATMDATGTYVLEYTTLQAGTDVIVAQAAGAKPLADPRIEIGGTALPPPSSTPSSFSLQAQPATVDSNPTGSANRSQLVARVFDATNLPVQNAQVSFRIAVGQQFGALATTDVVLTDASGFARTDFIAGAAGSAQDQIKVCAVVVNAVASPSNVLAGCNANESGVTLTVRETPVSVVIGASGKIIVPDDLQYRDQFLVQVARVGGSPVQGAIVTVDPIEHTFFFKGSWSGTPRTQTVTATCLNEDVNRNDILELGEDINANGRLDPRRPVNFRFVNGPTTDEFGQVLIEIIYPKSFGSWVSLDLSVRVTVGGSESRASIGFGALRVAQTEVESTGGTAFDVSPFGTMPGCNNAN